MSTPKHSDGASVSGDSLPLAKGLVCNVAGCTDHHHTWLNGERRPCLLCDPEAFDPAESGSSTQEADR